MALRPTPSTIDAAKTVDRQLALVPAISATFKQQLTVRKVRQLNTKLKAQRRKDLAWAKRAGLRHCVARLERYLEGA